MQESRPAPSISIVIPVYNEEAILRAAVVDLIDRLESLERSYEIILAENGSTDRTAALGFELSDRLLEVGHPVPVVEGGQLLVAPGGFA